MRVHTGLTFEGWMDKVLAGEAENICDAQRNVDVVALFDDENKLVRVVSNHPLDQEEQHRWGWHIMDRDLVCSREQIQYCDDLAEFSGALRIYQEDLDRRKAVYEQNPKGYWKLDWEH